jgi:hypothetical protein
MLYLASMDAGAIDPRLLHRVDRAAVRSRRPPADMDAATSLPVKPFQLWNVEREIFEIGKIEKEPVSIPRMAPAEKPGAGVRFRPEATRALRDLVPASTAAKKAYRAYRALMRVALTKRYVRGGPA